MRRRDFFKKAGIGSAALASLPAFADALTRPAFANSSQKKGEQPPDDTFVILLQGTYTPVVRCPDLGLLQVDLCDGSYSTVRFTQSTAFRTKRRNTAKRRRSATFTCSSVVGDPLSMTSRGVRWQWFSAPTTL
jgi:hypothetical protein